ncbi:hypothetical protein O3G_MSEX009780 [Manduca sexta]|uniref:N-acetyltransferase domain-containing protein n=1 Tax=Manduca sexta TaxID=7130 RepID=A0A921ZFH3_MANSE|nr:hypothetical protein O3G_MSEX009780 [Manduca sexta]
MDILQELMINKWHLLQKKLKNLWPHNVPGYYTLYLNTKCLGVRDAFKFKVYCPYGDMNNVFIAISHKGTFDCIIFSITEDTSKLEEAILNTKLIDWSQLVLFDLVTSVNVKCLERIRKVFEFSHWHLGRVKMYYLDRRTKPFEDLRCHSDTYLAPVKQDNIQRVDDTWPYRHSESRYYFSTLDSNSLSFGLFSSTTNKLLAWTFLNEYNFVCHLYCEEEFRRNGFAEYLVRFVVNRELVAGNDVYAYVEVGNERSAGLFAKLGFMDVDDSGYLFVQK